MRIKKVIAALVIISHILLLTSCSADTEPDKEYSAILKRNKHLEEKLDEIRTEKYIFPFGIPREIKLSDSGSYEIDQNSEVNAINGVVELVSRIYHMTSRMHLEDFKKDTNDVAEKTKIPIYSPLVPL